MKKFLLTIFILVCFVPVIWAEQVLPEKITKNTIIVEVKRKNEALKPEQIEWGEFLIKNKIPYKVLRVLPQ